VYRNFHEHVPVGESHFSVTLPKSYANIKLPSGDTLHRRFRFTELTATPGFFSQRALLLGADGDGTVEPAEADLSLNFSLGYTCHDTLYFVEGEDGQLEESVFDQGNRASTLQVFVEDFNAHHERLIPPGFRRTPVFWDWVDLDWYRTRGEPDRLQQESHDSADQTVVFRPDPAAMVRASDVVYYGVDSLDVPEALEPFAARGLPLSARTLTGVNPYSLPTLFETQVEGLPLAANHTVRNVRMRLHVAPNTTVSFTSLAQLEALGFTAEQLGSRTRRRYDFSNIGHGNEYLIFTGEAKPSFRLPALKAKVYCGPARKVAHQYGNERVVFPAGVFAENARAYGAIQRAVEEAKSRAGLLFPRISYDPVSTKFLFLFPDNDSLNLFFVCDDRLAERMGYGPTNRITNYSIPAAVRDTSSTVLAETLSKALVFDAGMCLVTLDGANSNDTFGTDDYAMTTLWPTASGTSFRMSEKFSRTTCLSTLEGVPGQQHLVQLKFNISTLKKDSVKIPISLPISFSVEGTLEGTL